MSIFYFYNLHCVISVSFAESLTRRNKKLRWVYSDTWKSTQKQANKRNPSHMLCQTERFLAETMEMIFKTYTYLKTKYNSLNSYYIFFQSISLEILL